MNFINPDPEKTMSESEEFDGFHTRSRDRKTEYARTVWSVMPAELREDMDLEVMEDFGIDRATTNG